MNALDVLVACWRTWDDRPTAEGPARDRIDAVNAYATETGADPVRLRRHMAAERRAGSSYTAAITSFGAVS